MICAISRRLLVAAAAGSALALSFALPAFAEVKLTFLVDNAPATVKASEALAAAFHAAQLKDVVEVEGRPEAVESRPHIGCGGGNVNDDPLADPGAHHADCSAGASVSARRFGSPVRLSRDRRSPGPAAGRGRRR